MAEGPRRSRAAAGRDPLGDDVEVPERHLGQYPTAALEKQALNITGDLV